MKHDFFKLAQEKVKSIMSNHNIDIDIYDDDKFSDFISFELDKHPFKLHEKQFIFTYNCMLQTIAFTVEDVRFTMEIL